MKNISLLIVLLSYQLVSSQNVLTPFYKCDTTVYFDHGDEFCLSYESNFSDTIFYRVVTYLDTIELYKVVELFDNKGKATISIYERETQQILSEHNYDSDLDGLPIDTINGDSIIYRYIACENGISKDWYSNGRLSSETSFSNCLINGVQKNYWENGQIKSKGIWSCIGRYYFEQKVGEWIYWSESGEVLRKVNYQNGLKIGEYYKFDTVNGLKTYGSYNIVYNEGYINTIDPTTLERKPMKVDSLKVSVKNGDWNTFDEIGQMKKTIFYKNGVKIKEIEYR